MAKALFISPKYIKRKSVISGDVDPDKMVQFIETAQDIHIQNYLGTNLYKKIQLLITTSTLDDVGNEAYKELLVEYIKPMLVWYSQAEYIPFSAYTIGNGGMFKHRSENSDTASVEEVSRLTTRANDKAIFYTNRFLEFVKDNEKDYPEYTQSNDDMSPDKEVDSFGWFLG